MQPQPAPARQPPQPPRPQPPPQPQPPRGSTTCERGGTARPCARAERPRGGAAGRLARLLSTAALLAAGMLLVPPATAAENASRAGVGSTSGWEMTLATTANSTTTTTTATATTTTATSGWRWPIDGSILINAPFAAPTHAYGAGHRGVDLVARVGSAVTAPSAGTIAFAGTVADRPLVTIDHGGGLVTTLEPVQKTAPVGAAVAAGALVGTVASGGHALADTLHVGVRMHGVYIDPVPLFLGAADRAMLLPCC